MKNTRILKKTLDNIGMKPIMQARLLGEAHHWSSQVPQSNPQQFKLWAAALAKSTTIADLIKMFGDSYRVWTSHDGSRYVADQSGVFGQFKAFLLKQGFTAEDWPRLAPTTAEIAKHILKRASRDKATLLGTSVMFLPMSSIAHSRLEFVLQRRREDITIGEFILMPQDSWSTYRARTLPDVEGQEFRSVRGANLSASVRSAREALRSLGLSSKDGIFLQEHSRDVHVDAIAHGLKVSTKKAQEIFDFFSERGWGPRIEQ